MKMIECRRKAIFDVGFIDPYHVNYATMENHYQDTEDNVVMFLKEQQFKPSILFPYNFE